jgi:hypothetical protein
MSPHNCSQPDLVVTVIENAAGRQVERTTRWKPKRWPSPFQRQRENACLEGEGRRDGSLERPTRKCTPARPRLGSVSAFQYAVNRLEAQGVAIEQLAAW